jgi:alpha-beta hydrolase superfamily lysophospholipase
LIKTIDNHDIKFLENVESKSDVVLLCHGITSSKEEGGFYNDFAEELNKKGLSTFRFDFRGHGESDIKSELITLPGMIADLYAVINFLFAKYDRVSIITASFGSSILLLLMQEKKLSFNSAIMLNPVIDYGSTFTSTISEWSKSFFPSNGIDNLLSVNNKIVIGENFVLNPLMAIEFYYYKPLNYRWECNTPAIIFHGEKDEIVSIEDSEKFVNNSLSKNLKLIGLKNSSHGLEEDSDEVITTSCDFIKRYL